jgi:hypothetical protein
LLVIAKPHHVLYQNTVVPAAVEEDDLAGGRHLSDVSLRIQLRPLTFRRRRQRDMSEDARADALHDAMNYSAFTGGVASLENHYNLRASGLHPVLHLDQLGLKFVELLLVLIFI